MTRLVLLIPAPLLKSGTAAPAFARIPSTAGQVMWMFS